MTKTKKEIKYPFLKKEGHQITYIESHKHFYQDVTMVYGCVAGSGWAGEIEPDNVEWKDNFEFEDELEYLGCHKGRSAARLTFQRTNGHKVEMTLSTFDDVILKLGLNGKKKEKPLNSAKFGEIKIADFNEKEI